MIKIKEEILEYFKDINHAYNDCTKFDTLKHMLDDLEQELRKVMQEESKACNN